MIKVIATRNKFHKKTVVTQNMGGHIDAARKKYVKHTDFTYQNAHLYDILKLKSCGVDGGGGFKWVTR